MGGKKSIFLSLLFCLILLHLPYKIHSKPQILKPSSKLHLPANAIGPESITFRAYSKNISISNLYTSISDGRVLHYVNGSFRDFATTAPNRSKAECDGKIDKPTCGRPLGLCFNHGTGDLFIVDAYIGLMKVGAKGGPAQPVASAVNGVPFVLLDALDVDPSTGIVYFVEASTKYQKHNAPEAIKAGDKTGRLLKYDPQTKKVTVLLRNLGFPVGVAVSRNGEFVVFSEFIFNRIQIYWVDKPGPNRSKVWAELPGRPDNIKKFGRNEFWVAVNNETASFGQKLSSDGKVLNTVIFDVANTTSPSSISEVNEHFGKFYVGSVELPYVSVFDKSK